MLSLSSLMRHAVDEMSFASCQKGNNVLLYSKVVEVLAAAGADVNAKDEVKRECGPQECVCVPTTAATLHPTPYTLTLNLES